MIGFNEVARFLSDHTEDVLASARVSVTRAHLPHYEQTGDAVTMERLSVLLALVVRCAAERHLAPITAHAANIAVERRAAGFDVGEVLTAINVVEEAVWRTILAEMPPEEQGSALGVVGTILGAAKDKLACTYVSLASKVATPTLDLTELFHGSGEGDGSAL